MYVNVKDFGAVGDGATDDTEAIQNAMNAITDQGASMSSQGGGTLFFPSGSYIVSGPLTVGGSNLWIQGVGKRNTQFAPLWVTPASDPEAAKTVPSTLYLTTPTAGFVFPNTNYCNGFRAHGLTLAGLPATDGPLASPPASGWPQPQIANGYAYGVGDGTVSCSGTPMQSAFLFDMTDPQGVGYFNRDFIFEEISITGCGVAFNVFSSSESTGLSEGATGVIRVVRCSVQYNEWIALTCPNLHWNNFIYHQNDSGDNFSGGINIIGENVSICDNVLESTPNAVCVGSSGYQSTVVANNYFEANTGEYCICMDTLEGPWVVGPNNFNLIKATHNVLAVYTARGVCHDPAWLQSCINVQTPEPGTSAFQQLVLNNAATDWYLRVDTQFATFAREPVGTVVAGPVYGHSSKATSVAKSPFDGSPMHVVAESTDAAPAFTFPDATLQIPTYSASPPPLWLVGSIAMRLLSPPPQSTPSPTFTLTLTGANITTTSSSPPQVVPSGTPLPSPIAGYTDFVRTGDWALVTFALAIQGTNDTAGTQAVTASLQALPYGSDAPGGLQYELRPPILYAVGDINDARPFFDPFEARIK